MVFFLIYSMVLCSLKQIKIFWQLYLIEMLGLLAGLWLLGLWHFIYPRLLTGFSMLVFFTNLSFMEFQLIGSVHRNIQLMLEFLKSPYLVVICNIAIYVDDTTLTSKCDQAVATTRFSF